MKIVIKRLKINTRLFLTIGLITLLNCEKTSSIQQYNLEIQLLELHNWLERGHYENEYKNEISYYIMRDNTLKTQLISHSSDTLCLTFKMDTCEVQDCFQSTFQAIIEPDTIDIFGISSHHLILLPYDTIPCLLKFDLNNHKFDKFWSREMSIYTENMIDATIISKTNQQNYNNSDSILNIVFTKSKTVWVYNQQEEAYKMNLPK